MKNKLSSKTFTVVVGGTLLFGLLYIVNNLIYHLSEALKTNISWNQALADSLGQCGLFGINLYSFIVTGCLALALIAYIAYEFERMKTNIRPKEEHGSAKQGNVAADSVELKSKDDVDIILSKNLVLDMNTRHTNINDNVMVIGDSGSWKTMSYVKPNLLQLHSNYVVIDPKGAVAEEVGNAFKEGGYEIRYLNTVDMKKSMCYNPFSYFREPNDIQKFVNNLIENTTPETKGSGGDPFFDRAEITLITALCFYVRHVFAGDPEHCTFNSVMDLLLLAEVKEEDESYQSPLDDLFDKLDSEVTELRKNGVPYELYQFGELGVKNYIIFKSGSGKTIKSVLISVGVRLNVFNLPQVRRIMSKDELHLERLGKPMVKSKDPKLQADLEYDTAPETEEEIYDSLPKDRLRKMVLFVIVSDSDSTFSFLTAIILQQMYDQLYCLADSRQSHQLPIHVRVINDEFANCGKQKDIEKKMATMRSRNISCSIVIQGISQLKDLYEKKWEGIFENCPTTLFLGGKGPTTTEMLSKIIGNETVVYRSTTKTKGQSGSISHTDQIYQRPLYGPDEINRIPMNHCLIHIRGRQIYEDEKYNLFEHPNIELTVHAKDKRKAAANHFDIFAYKTVMEEVDRKRTGPAEEPDKWFVDGDLSPENSQLRYLSDEMLIQLISDRTESTDELLDLLPS